MDLDCDVGDLEMYVDWMIPKLGKILEEDYSLGEKKANEIKAAIDAILKEKLSIIKDAEKGTSDNE